MSAARATQERTQLELITLQSQLEANPGMMAAVEDRLLVLTMDLTRAEADLAEAEAEMDEFLNPAEPLGGGGADDDGMSEALRRSMEEETLPAVRRFSASEPELASALRTMLAGLVIDDEEHGLRAMAETPPVFVVPAFGDATMQALVNKLLIDEYVTARTEADDAGVLNWRRSETGASRAVVLHTLGDGNCLCHSASLLLWRVHDRTTVLRSCIASTLMPSSSSDAAAATVAAIKARFFAERKRIDVALGIQEPSETALASQWDEQLGLVMTDHGASLRAGYLTELHAFVLANVLRRPIVLFGDHDALLAGMVGVYLPLLWGDPGLTSRAPLVVLFNGAHFSAVTTVQGTSGGERRALLLQTKAGTLPPRFLTPDEHIIADDLLAAWLELLPESEAYGAPLVALDPLSAHDPVHVFDPEASSASSLVATLQRQFFVTMRNETSAASATPVAAATPRDGQRAFAFPDS